MSVAIVYSRALSGVHAPLVTVEVHLSGGLPAFNLVGLPETEVRESRDRVRAALQNARFEFPQWKITVNLAPSQPSMANPPQFANSISRKSKASPTREECSRSPRPAAIRS